MKYIGRLKSDLTKNLSNVPGWSTKEKIIVFLVDDWGTIRISDPEARTWLRNQGVDVDSNRFNKYDTLASANDLSALFSVLKKNKDIFGNPASFTALSVVANPCFQKIKAAGFEHYFYESFTETLKHYFPQNDVFETWQQGIEEGIFIPQFHGREHLNVDFWLKGLSAGDKNLMPAFEVQSVGPAMAAPTKSYCNYMAAFDFEENNDVRNLTAIATDGLRLFEKVFGYPASLFTSSSLIHSTAMEGPLQGSGIDFIDRAKITLEPLGQGNYKKGYFRLGQINNAGQRYITRNVMFEPNAKPRTDVIGQALKDIAVAFRWHKPAIISSHRVNYVGEVDEKNRKIGLAALDELLRGILKHWPDVHFMSFNDFAKKMKKA